ncbi:MAG: SpoIIE family protein phosphatase [Victivallaceae bacterium]|nr:SpoIIE family protein phosphatase [Victivallaceae bacterium]
MNLSVWGKLGIAAKQNILLASLLVVLIGGCFWMIRDQVYSMANVSIDRTALLAVQSGAARINESFSPITAAAQELAMVLSASQPDEAMQKKLLTRTLEKVHEINPSLCAISIAYEPYRVSPHRKYYMLYAQIDAAGKVRIDQIGGPDYPYEKYDWFVLPRTLGKPLWTEPYFDTFAGVGMSTYTTPFFDASGKFLGITGFDLSLTEIARQVRAADAYGHGMPCLVSRFGRFVAFPDASKIDNLAEFTDPVLNSTVFSMADAMNIGVFSNRSNDGELMRGIGREMLAGRSGSALVNLVLEKGTQVRERFFFAPVKNPGWSLGVIYTEKELSGGLRRLDRYIILFSVGALLLMLIAITVTVRRVSRPLTKLATAADVIGGGDFNAPLPEVSGGDEVSRLTEAFRRMQSKLSGSIACLEETTRQREKIESELEVAHHIQRALLPEMLPPLPNAPEFSLCAVLNPARMVGGDLYDFFKLDDHRYLFVVGDVSGKGVPAALFMAITQTLQRSEAERFADPVKLVTRMNKLLSRSNESMMFVTYFAGVLDLASGDFDYCNAGHNPPLIARGDHTLDVLTGRHGMALGVDADAVYQGGHTRLKPGDTMLIYTDGVSEAEDTSGRLFGINEVEKIMIRRSAALPDIIADDILGAVAKFTSGAEQSDDITLLAVKYNGPAKA